MKKLGNMELYSFEEVKDEIIGEVGSPERNEYEREVSETLEAYKRAESEKSIQLESNATEHKMLVAQCFAK